jgi:hypothetical protein
MGITWRFVILTAVGAAIFAIVESWVDAHLHSDAEGSQSGNGTNTVPPTSGSSWTNTGYNGDLSMATDGDVYYGPGRQHPRISNNGQIFASKFHRGGNPNSQHSGEVSYAFQTATKNPFANGTYNGYQNAVDSATSDPTNNVNRLVLGPNQAVNND